MAKTMTLSIIGCVFDRRLGDHFVAKKVAPWDQASREIRATFRGFSMKSDPRFRLPEF